MAYDKLSTYKTKIVREGDAISVLYHQTMIVSADPSTLVLDAGGWQTVTTKRKMNQAANQFGLGFGVYQRNHAWNVVTKAGEFPFFGVMVIDRASGRPLA